MTGIHICLGGPVVQIGRYLVEIHPHCGPQRMRKDGEPRVRQPGPRSPFWDAWESWCAEPPSSIVVDIVRRPAAE